MTYPLALIADGKGMSIILCISKRVLPHQNTGTDLLIHIKMDMVQNLISRAMDNVPLM
jgi:hypothetical protein